MSKKIISIPLLFRAVQAMTFSPYNMGNEKDFGY